MCIWALLLLLICFELLTHAEFVSCEQNQDLLHSIFLQAAEYNLLPRVPRRLADRDADASEAQDQGDLGLLRKRMGHCMFESPVGVGPGVFTYAGHRLQNAL